MKLKYIIIIPIYSFTTLPNKHCNCFITVTDCSIRVSRSFYDTDGWWGGKGGGGHVPPPAP